MFLTLLGGLVGGAVSAILGGSVATTITTAIIAGVLVATVGDVLTQSRINEIARTKSNLEGTCKQMVYRAKNKVKLEDFLGHTMEIQGDSIADDVESGFITI